MEGELIKKGEGAEIAVSPYIQLIGVALEKGTNLGQIEKMMELQERYEANQALKVFNSAMSEFQGLLPVIEKNGVVDYTSQKGRTNYNYAKIEDIAKAIKPAIKASGLSYRFTQNQSQGLIQVTCTVTHAGGHSISSSLSSSPDTSGGKDPLKAIASAISYLRRYTLTGLLGIVTGGEDDDAGGATAGGNNKEESFCTQKMFEDSFPGWSESIVSGKKTAGEVINFLNNKGLLFSQDQLNKFNEVG